MTTLHERFARTHAEPAAGARCAEGRDAFGILAHCHERILETLGRVEAAVHELTAADGDATAPLARIDEARAFLARAIPLHTADEEQSLFPRLRALPLFAGAGPTPMDCMESDHDAHAELRDALASALAEGDPVAVSRHALALVAEYRDHIAKEDGILFPLAREQLTDPAVLAEMTEEMRARRRDDDC